MVQATLNTYTDLDVLVNNAGRTGFHQGNPIIQTDESDWDMSFKVNLRGTFFCTKAVYNLFKEQRRGKIVNIASQAGKYGDGSLPHYSASKAGIINLTQSTAKELAPYNVNVNAVCPGYIFTPMWEGLKDYAKSLGMTTHDLFAAYCKKTVPMQRELYPEDIANAVLFFASEAARNITSQAINVDGGTREH